MPGGDLPQPIPLGGYEEVHRQCGHPRRRLGVRKGGHRPANTAHGKQQRITCSKYETHGCRWGLTYEHTSEGAWYLFGRNFPGSFSGHSHDLCADTASVHAHRNGLFIPQELTSLACDAAKGAPAGTVHAILKNKAKELGLPVTWDSAMVYDTFVRDRTPDSMDMSDMVENLMNREKDKGLRSFVKTISTADGGLVVDRVFMEMDRAMQEYARGGSENVVLFDPTANTNKYKAKLCPFVTVGSTGQTVILAIALINLEDTAHILWAFECFHAVFKVKPLTLVTDEGAAILAAFDLFSAKPGVGWHNVVHRLCIFHLSKNFWTHISPLFSDRSKFHQVTSLFWRICKCTDANATDSFDGEWDGLIEVVAEYANNTGSKLESAKVWLQQIKMKAPRFVYRFTWSQCTYLINSTVRSEAINSAVKVRMAKSNMKLSTLVDNLDEYNLSSREQKNADAVRLALRQLSAPALPVWIDRLRSKVTPYAFELVTAQYTLSVNYAAELLPDQDDVDVWHREYKVLFLSSVSDQRSEYIYDDLGNLTSSAPEDFGLFDGPISRVASIVSCSCQFSIASGLDLCRHRMNRISAQIDQISVSNYSTTLRLRKQVPGASQQFPKSSVEFGQASQPARFLKMMLEMG